MITAEHLTKRFGAKTAVDDVSFVLQPGTVTGFLGPNGAGKSTTMRMLVALDRPDEGRVQVNGRPFATYTAPMTEVGALLDASAVNPRRTARAHLRMLAATNGIGRSRVDEVLELTGLSPAARRRVGGFSLGMRQRLGIAASVLGDPHTILLDEPVNGLDPEGVLWIRSFVRSLAAEGRTVLLSSHLMSEVSQTADRIIVLGRGKVLADAPISDFLGAAGRDRIRVRASEPAALAERLHAEGGTITTTDDGALEVEGIPAARIARHAAALDLDLHELSPQRASLEEAYLALTDNAVEYRSHPATAAA